VIQIRRNHRRRGLLPDAINDYLRRTIEAAYELVSFGCPQLLPEEQVA